MTPRSPTTAPALFLLGLAIGAGWDIIIGLVLGFAISMEAGARGFFVVDLILIGGRDAYERIRPPRTVVWGGRPGYDTFVGSPEDRLRQQFARMTLKIQVFVRAVDNISPALRRMEKTLTELHERSGPYHRVSYRFGLRDPAPRPIGYIQVGGPLSAHDARRLRREILAHYSNPHV